MSTSPAERPTDPSRLIPVPPTGPTEEQRAGSPRRVPPLSPVDARVLELFRSVASLDGIDRSVAIAELCRWRARAEDLLAQTSDHLDPIFQAQIREMIAGRS